MIKMMRVVKVDLNHLKNNLHFRLMNEVVDTIEGIPIVLAKIRTQFEQFLLLCEQEDACLNRVRKSNLTAEIEQANRDRNGIFRGLSDANLASVNHYLPDVSAAARRIRTVLDSFGNVSKLSMDEETTAINSLLTTLDKNYMEDMEKTMLTGWVAELERRNIALIDLVMMRYQEISERGNQVMAEVRSEVDEVYQVLVACIEVLWILAAEAEEKKAFEKCIRLLNTVMGHYNSMLAYGKSRGSSTRDQEEMSAENETPVEPEALSEEEEQPSEPQP